MNPASIELIRNVRQQLLGPAGTYDECIFDNPVNRYVVGIIKPYYANHDSNLEGEYVLDTGGVEEGDEIKQDTKPQLNSFGISFKMINGTFNVLVSYGKYHQVKLNNKDVYKRQSVRHNKLGIKGTCEFILEYTDFSTVILKVDEYNGYFNVMVYNKANQKIKYDDIYRYSLFQPSIRINVTGGLIDTEACGNVTDSNIKFLYRDTKELARGKNCAAIWKALDVENENDSVNIKLNSWPDYSDNYKDFYIPDIRTDFMPVYKSYIPETRKLETEFNAENMAEKNSSMENLDILINEYRSWITSITPAVPKDEIQVKTNIENLLETCNRMERGLQILRGNKDASRAFRFVNRVMATNSQWHRRDSNSSFNWRAFQIAFLLMEIESITDPASVDRDKMDILWVHTGSGKTEAYLAVALFDIIWRRYKSSGKDDNPGTSIITRYTLRLLTSQQFRRTVDLIVAAEYVRNNFEEFNDNINCPISAGMWVGGGMTPNKISDAVKVIQNSVKGESEKSEGDPVQLYKCPACGSWLAIPTGGIRAGTPIFAAGPCGGVTTTADVDIQLLKEESVYGARMGVYRIVFPNKMEREDIINSTLYEDFHEAGTYLNIPGYRISHDHKDIYITCMNPECRIFNTRIPVYTVDDQIYSRKPSIIVATVDKFANIPFNPLASNILGDINKKTKPPDLIIQDEMHLLNGPLGSLFGLYENMVDAIIENRGDLKVKYIGASATVSSVEDQVSLLFARRASVFPPSGIQQDENFFFTKDYGENHRTRIYAGIMGAPDLGVQTPLIRLMAQIIAFRENFRDTSDLKNFYTPVFYFNSIKELSIATSLFREDVRELLEKFTPPVKLDTANYEELSGKAKSAEIPVKLDRLESWNITPEENTGALFTTSMFGTGVDISRLTEMIMSGQPKSTSDYIQATGRIGRSADGVVFVLYNPLKPRDISHYEMFMQYHSRINIYVERSPVSPFSTGSMETGMGATITGFVRAVEPELRDDPSKILIYKGSIFDDFIRKTEDRLRSMDIKSGDIISEIHRDRDKWHQIVSNQKSKVIYRSNPYKMPPPDDVIILGSSRDTVMHPLANIVFKNVPNSLREVDDIAVFGHNKTAEYTIRQTQFVLSFGPESILEGDHGSYLIQRAGLYGIQSSYYLPQTVSNNTIDESNGYARNLIARKFNYNAEYIKFISLPSNEYVGKNDQTPIYEVMPFPTWGICSNVNNHRKKSSILYQYLKKTKNITKIIGCPECGSYKYTPVRFVSACPMGHLDDVNWNFSVHGGNMCYPNYYYWDAGGYSLKSIHIECSKCGRKTNMGNIYGVYNKNMIKCPIPDNKGTVCGMNMSIAQRDSSSLRLPEIITLLNINSTGKVPQNTEEKLIEAAGNAWKRYNDIKLLESILLKLDEVDPKKHQEIISNPDKYYFGNSSDDIIGIFRNEFRYLSESTGSLIDEEFRMGEFTAAKNHNYNGNVYYRPIQNISAIAIQTSYIRNTGGKKVNHVSVPSCTEYRGEHYFPATILSGDAIFIRFNNIKIHSEYTHSEFNSTVFDKYPLDYTFTYLHTLSHSILRAISEYTGYSLPSIRERIYAFGNSGGILIYTTGVGSDGSMGGLVDLVNHDKMEKILDDAIHNVSICSNDPFCLNTKMTADKYNGSACYSCILLPETSCEYGNKYLDRNAVLM
ncbi:MAG: DrmB family protein [Ferroplasma sp.]|uniref:DrmB family protein n=1 Tax=Ferroplasma sp. TaxID=2591003 RepID=UPI0028161F49|nr:DrmB family protein [Ferroplasma sp.]WMT50544.1 MAG: DrmB family protein [Ferroplasma sp.]